MKLSHSHKISYKCTYDRWDHDHVKLYCSCFA